jgi:hypothetical protein
MAGRAGDGRLRRVLPLRLAGVCAIALAGAVVVVLLTQGGGASGSPAGSYAGPQLATGPFAGYFWYGDPDEVAASWRVPAILSPSRWGVAATWIGIEGVGADAFIQVGTEEVRFATSRVRGRLVREPNEYGVFWSSDVVGDVPQPLFRVRPGDVINVSLSLGAGVWHVAIDDATSHRQRRFVTADGAIGPFERADWLQEDVTNGVANSGVPTPFPYPRLAPVEFTAMSLDSGVPRFGALLPAWMAPQDQRGYIAPHQLGKDAFVTGPGVLSDSAARLLRIMLGTAPATQTFTYQLAGTDLRTLVLGAAQGFGAALGKAVRALSAAQWPARARPFIAATIQRLDSLIAISDPPTRPAAFARWRARIGILIEENQHATLPLLRALAAPYVEW